MDPVARIRLVQLLEEISRYQKSSENNRRNAIYTMVLWMFYYIMLFFIYQKPITQSPEYLLLLVPMVVMYAWHRIRDTMEDRFKLLADAVLEIGSVPPADPVPAPATPRSRRPASPGRKNPPVRKKKP